MKNIVIVVVSVAALVAGAAEYQIPEGVTFADVAKAYRAKADALKKAGKGGEARQIYEQLLAGAGNVEECAVNAARTFAGRDKPKYFSYLEGILNNYWRYPLTDRQKSRIWDKYAYEGYLQLNPEKMWKGRQESLKLGGFGGDYAGRLVEAKGCWDDLKTFPIDEASVRWPERLEDFGYTPNGRTVKVSKDFGFDPVNATPYLMAALTSGASRVIIDYVGKPWYTRQLKVPSNIEIVLEKGVRVHTDRTWKEFKKGGIFLMNCVSNVIIRGENANDHDVVVSQFHDLADRCKNCRNYGRSGFTMESSRNVAIKNMRIAEMAEDALMFGGLRCLNRNMYFENLDLDSCFRQACSLCNDDRTFFRHVRFRGTAGAEPGAGIDLEPAETCQGNASIYLYDCSFEDNLGGGLLFSTSSELPITIQCKRCTFEPHRNGDLMVFIRIGCYLGNYMKVPGKALFEGCTFKGYSDISPIRIDGISLMDLTFKDCVIRDTGKTLQRDGRADASAISFNLNRDVYYEGFPKGYPEAMIDFGNMRIEGYTNAAPILYRNAAGHTAIRNLKGTFDFNGKKVNAGQYTWKGPDNALTDIAHEFPALTAAQACRATADGQAAFPAFNWDGSWWSARPQINYCFFGEKGQKATLVFHYVNKLWGRKDITVKSFGGKTFALGEFQQGDNAVAFTIPETGWYAIEPPNNHRLIKAQGVMPVYFTGAGVFRDVQFDAPLGYVGYFEVPAKGEATIKVELGALTIRDAAGEVVCTCAASPRTGAAYAKLKSKSGKSEVWSFTLYDRADVTFFAPFSGLFADSPEAVPSAADAIRTKVIPLVAPDAKGGDSAADGATPAVDLPALLAEQPVFAKIVANEAARLADWAKKGEFGELAANERAILERMRKGPLNEQVQKEISDEQKNLPPLEMLEAQEKRVAKMNAAQLQRYAFVNAFAVLKGFYQDKTFAQPFMRCRYENAEMARQYKDVYWCIYKKDFEDYIRWWLGEYKLDFRDFTVICDDDRKLDAIIPVLKTYALSSLPPDLKEKK